MNIRLSVRFMVLAFALIYSFSADRCLAEDLPVHKNWGGEFTLTDQNGLDISLSDFRDKVVLEL